MLSIQKKAYAMKETEVGGVKYVLSNVSKLDKKS